MQIFASTRIQEVVIHDLRTPLNVIRLALRMLDDSAASRDPEAAEDLTMIRSNEAELERMLAYLVEVARLPRDRSELAPQRFRARRLLDEVLAEHGLAKTSAPVEIVDDGSVAEVDLDYVRAKMAWEKALANVVAASSGKPVRVRLSGGPERCVIAFETDVPPRATVSSHEIVPEEFQRVLGTPGERRGLDLAITGVISNLFGGTARIEATPGRGSAVILDWPSRLGGVGPS